MLGRTEFFVFPYGFKVYSHLDGQIIPLDNYVHWPKHRANKEDTTTDHSCQGSSGQASGSRWRAAGTALTWTGTSQRFPFSQPVWADLW